MTTCSPNITAPGTPIGSWCDCGHVDLVHNKDGQCEVCKVVCNLEPCEQCGELAELEYVETEAMTHEHPGAGVMLCPECAEEGAY